MTNLICYNKAMDKLAYHYNKKKLPAKTEGKYLYYYPCADIENVSIQMGGRGFVTIEVTEKEWEALIELDRIEYNNEHKYIRHIVPIPDGEEDDLTAKQQEQLHVKDTPIDTAVAEYWDNKSLHSQLSKEEETITFKQPLSICTKPNENFWKRRCPKILINILSKNKNPD